jgi:DNA-binding response OmpR family regulator
MSLRPVLLYVHDNPGDGRAFQAAMTEARVKFKVELVRGFYEGVDYLSRQGKFALSKQPEPALVLLDYFLGSYKGTDLLRWMRERAASARLTVVVFSRSAELSHIAESYVRGADYYLVNGGNPAAFMTVVQRLDDCLKEEPPRLESLRELSVHAELARQALRADLRDGLAKHSDLLTEHLERAAQLEASMAEQKERKKQVPFVPKPPRKPGPGGSSS